MLKARSALLFLSTRYKFTNKFSNTFKNNLKMSSNKFLQQALTDIKVKLDSEFKENFTRKAFFNEKWKNTPYIF